MHRPVLSLFPGWGLLDRAFEAEGFTVVRGPDLLWGGDAARFRGTRGAYQGVIGGPPCQRHSRARAMLKNSKAVDMIPEFVRIVGECAPEWVVMENVSGVIGHEMIPKAWIPTLLRDCDCGGETVRQRVFWTWPFLLMAPGGKWSGQAALSVMATTGRRGGGSYSKDKGFLPGTLPLEEYERLQGVPGATKELRRAGGSKRLAVHMLGNGVPLALGRHVARAVRAAVGG